MSMFKAILIANRSEIAVRIVRTLRAMNIRSIPICSDFDHASYSDIDHASPHVTLAGSAVRLPGNTAAETYLRSGLIRAAAKPERADAIIPGYGFQDATWAALLVKSTSAMPNSTQFIPWPASSRSSSRA
jgi:acetyl/propionyl-CoA carboxylase alpha subunit